MSEFEMFDSAARSANDLAGVFEYDGETAYFYLYDMETKTGQQVVGAIRVLTTLPDFKESDVQIHWDADESKVGLYIRGQLWAAFDCTTGGKYGGNYSTNGRAEIPTEIAAAFE